MGGVGTHEERGRTLACLSCLEGKGWGNCQYDLRKRKKGVPCTLRLLTNIGGAHDNPLPVLSLVHAASGHCVVLSQPCWGKPILTATNGLQNCSRNRVGMVGHLRR